MSTIKVDTLQTRAGSTAAVTGAGSLKVDNLRGNTAAASITLGDGSNTLGALSTAGGVTITGEGGTVTTNLQQGLAKVWVQFDGSASGAAARDSFNVSGMTDNSAGNHTVAFNNDMAGAGNYTSSGNAGQFSGAANNNVYISHKDVAAGSLTVQVLQAGDTSIDQTFINNIIHGDLA